MTSMSRLFSSLFRPFFRRLVKVRVVDHNRGASIPGKPIYLIERNRWSHRELVKNLQNSQRPPGQIITFDSNSHQLKQTFRTLLQNQLDRPTEHYHLIQIGIYHGRMPRRERNWLRLLFSEGSGKHSALSRALQLILNGRLTLIRIARPLALAEMVQHGQTLEVSCNYLLLQLHNQFSDDRRRMYGPDLSHRRTILTRTLKDPQLQQAIRQQAQSTQTSHERLEQQCKQNLQQIAANFNPITARFLHTILGWVWHKLYDQVRVINAEELPKDPDHQLVYLPCHRSHMDYLLLSYMLFESGMMLPHIAAGDNLNIPVIGPMLRKGGAFFMRRSFKGDKLYHASFKAYLAHMSRRGHSLEYFLEGGRSRTGRLLPAKTGLLSMTVENHRINPAQAVTIIPVWISYDRLVEHRSYRQELAGARKKNESLLSMLSVFSVLKKRYGEASLSFGQPIPLQLDAQNNKQQINHLAQQVLCHINRAAVVNSSALIATVTLARPNEIHTRQGIEQQLQGLAQLLPLLSNAPAAMPESDANTWLTKAYDIGILSDSKDGLISPTETQFNELSLYRNNIQHLLIIPGLIVLLIQRLKTPLTLSIERIITQLYPFLQAELFLPWDNKNISGAIKKNLQSLQLCGLISKQGVQWKLQPSALNLTLIKTAEPILLRYYICLSVLQRFSPIERDDLLQSCLKLALDTHRLYGVESAEYADSKVFETYIDQQVSLNLLQQKDTVLSLQIEPTRILNHADKVLPNQLTEHIAKRLECI